jgi:hypothetical protein
MMRLALFLLFLPVAAFAQTAAPIVLAAAPSSNAFGQILTDLIEVAGLVILSVGGAFAAIIAAKLRQKYGIEVSAAQQAQIEDVAKKAVTWGITESTRAIAQKGWDHPEVHNAIVQQAADYAIAKFPDAMANAGLDISTPAARSATAANLANGIMQRVLPDAMSTAAASPATPPAPAAVAVAVPVNPLLSPKPLPSLVGTAP